MRIVVLELVRWDHLDCMEAMRLAYEGAAASDGLHVNWTQIAGKDAWLGVCRWNDAAGTHECNIRLSAEQQSRGRKALGLEQIDIVVDPTTVISSVTEIVQLLRQSAKLL